MWKVADVNFLLSPTHRSKFLVGLYPIFRPTNATLEFNTLYKCGTDVRDVQVF